MTVSTDVLDIFTTAGALLDGDHFVYVNGSHGAGWVAKDLLSPSTDVPARLGALLADAVRERGWQPDFICGPATGGLITSQWTAHSLGVRSVFTEHDPSSTCSPAPFVLRRGFDAMVGGRPVVAVDDIINTGHSIRETIDALRAAGADVIGAAAWVTRGNVDAAGIGVGELVALATVDIPSWPATGCRLCLDGVAINTRYAHGAEFVAQAASAGQ